MTSTRALLLLIFPLGVLAATNDHDKVTISPEPAWVSPATIGAYTVSNAMDASEMHLLIDKQINVETRQGYVRVVRKILNRAGVQDGSQISISFDPAFATLAMHRLQIHRGDQVLNRLDLEKLQVLQRERELERHIYNGQLSVVALLNDVRVGDEIEYSYTVTGTNPIFDGKFFDSFTLQFPIVVQRFRYRLLWPADRALFTRNQDTKVKPVINTWGQGKEYIWEAAEVPALLPEPGIPAWYEPYARVQLSEFGTWHETAQWAARLFKLPTEISPSLERQIAEWKTNRSSPDAALLAALHFVQDEIRYLGVEVGKQTHEPTDPSTVFERRFGDCKDKALLLCAILDRLGFQASPALVNAQAGYRVEQWQPSPLAFNHAVVRLVRAGETFWVDPTLSNQRGSLAQHFIPDYGRALIAIPGTTNLSVVPLNNNASPRTIVRESYSITESNAPVELRVVTTYEGEDADVFRNWLAQIGRTEVESCLLNTYAQQYKAVTPFKPLVVKDSDGDNKIQTIESYWIHALWKEKDLWSRQCSLFAAGLVEILPEPRSPNIRMPLAISHPRRHLHVLSVDLPENIRLVDKDQVIRGPADELRVRRVNGVRNVRLELDYRTLADFVPPEKMAEHRRARSEIQDNLGVALVWTPRGDPYSAQKLPTPNRGLLWSVIGFSVAMFLVFRTLKKRTDLAV